MGKKNIRAIVQKKVQSTIEEVTKTGSPASIEIMGNDQWVLQLLVVPPSTVSYGATTVRRSSPGVLLSIRSAKLWRNNLNIKSREAFEALKELLDEFSKDEELKNAVLDSITTRETRPTKKILLEELE